MLSRRNSIRSLLAAITLGGLGTLGFALHSKPAPVDTGSNCCPCCAADGCGTSCCCNDGCTCCGDGCSCCVVQEKAVAKDSCCEAGKTACTAQ